MKVIPRVIQSVFVSCYCIFSYIVLIFHISRITRDKITMPQPPHAHRNHPPITSHPKTVFLSDLSVCITDSSEGTPVALHNRFDEPSTISEIPDHHRHRQTPHHHHHTITNIHVFIHIYVCHKSTFAYLTSSFTGAYHSHPTCSRSLIRFTSRCHHESEQLDERCLCLLRLFKLIGS